MHIELPLRLNSLFSFNLASNADETQAFDELSAFIGDLDEGVLLIVEELRSSPPRGLPPPRLFAAVVPFDSQETLSSLLACAQMEVTKVAKRTGKDGTPTPRYAARLFTCAPWPSVLQKRLMDELSACSIPCECSTMTRPDAILKFSVRLPGYSIETGDGTPFPSISDQEISLLPCFGSFDSSGRYRSHLSKSQSRHRAPSAASPKTCPDAAVALKSGQILVIDMTPYPFDTDGVSAAVQSEYRDGELLFFVVDLGCQTGVFYPLPNGILSPGIASQMVESCILRLKTEVKRKGAILQKNLVSQPDEDIVYGLENPAGALSKPAGDMRKICMEKAKEKISREFSKRKSSRIEWDGSRPWVWIDSRKNTKILKTICAAQPAITVAEKTPETDERVKRLVLTRHCARDFFLVAPSRKLIRRDMSELDFFAPLDADQLLVWAFDARNNALFFLREPFVGLDTRKRFNPNDLLSFMVGNQDNGKLFVAYAVRENASILSFVNALRDAIKTKKPTTDVELRILKEEYQNYKTFVRFGLDRNAEKKKLTVSYLSGDDAQSTLDDMWNKIRSRPNSTSPLSSRPLSSG